MPWRRQWMTDGSWTNTSANQLILEHSHHDRDSVSGLDLQVQRREEIPGSVTLYGR